MKQTEIYILSIQFVTRLDTRKQNIVGYCIKMREVKSVRQSISKLSVIFKHWLLMNSSTPLLRVSLINYRSQFVRNLKYRWIVALLYNAPSTLHGLLTNQIRYFHQIMRILVPFILDRSSS
jgi:hypothetical protein